MAAINPIDIAKDRKDILVPLLIMAVIIIGIGYFFSHGGDYLSQSDAIAGLVKKTSSRNNSYTSYPQMTLKEDTGYQALISTNKGNIKIQLYAEDTPLTVNNFVTLSRDGFYEGTIFFRVIKDSLIQGGDPLGNGTGGPGYEFKDEIVPKYKFSAPGVVAMANRGANTNGSQFFITATGSDLSYLNGKHTIFGRVIQGQNVVDAISEVPVSGESPVKPVVINSIMITEIPQ